MVAPVLGIRSESNDPVFVILLTIHPRAPDRPPGFVCPGEQRLPWWELARRERFAGRLSPESQAGDDLLIAVLVAGAQIVKQPAPA
ncbi:MAG TPA: hypothetical protein VNN17_04870, partial [Terriglobia bacterium]|nr:hypothetical protein [Terriglobia bacterium]